MKKGFVKRPYLCKPALGSLFNIFGILVLAIDNHLSTFQISVTRLQKAMARSYDAIETPSNSYASLLQDLRSHQKLEPPRKKRKFNTLPKHESNGTAAGDKIALRDTVEDLAADLAEPSADSGDEADDGLVPAGTDNDDDDVDGSGDTLLRDPFEKHYFIASNLESVAVGEGAKTQPKAVNATIADGIRRAWSPRQERSDAPRPVKTQQDLHLKQRLVTGALNLPPRLSAMEKDLAGAIFNYYDVIAGSRTVGNALNLRDLCALHSLNHVFKTRDRVLKNNAKLSQTETPEALDVRDQGFTRPKVLILLPTKQACVKFVESIVKLSEPEQQENKSRFLDQFSREEEDEWHEKAEDFRELFGGNHEEDFRIGLKFTRKTIKYFSGFYNSDIIVSSPLGLMRTITKGAGEDEGKNTHEADFLSSIEIAIVDNASALQMQNWQHVDYVFSQLNQLPKESHGCDFSRVRNSYLDGHSKYLRQTIVLSTYLTPEINALVSSQLHNLDGRVKYVPNYKGVMLEVSSKLSMPVSQTFLRFDSPSPLKDGDARFKYFTSTTLPQLLRDKANQPGVLLFVPSYADFTKLRNHLSNSSEGTSISFGSISEYTPVKDVARARSHFMHGRHSLLLYSERAHHYFRYRIRGVRKVVFYGVPENPIFWGEIAGLLGLEAVNTQGDDAKAKVSVRAIFSRWDILKLERVVGTERVGKLVSERIGDTFDFV